MAEILRLDHGVRAPEHARRWIVERCHRWQCDDLADSAALLVSELVTNVFLHARTDCLVHAEFDDSVLAVTVTDNDAHELFIQSTGISAEGGRGLAIVEAVADGWGVRQVDGVKSVWFHLNDPPAA